MGFEADILRSGVVTCTVPRVVLVLIVLTEQQSFVRRDR